MDVAGAASLALTVSAAGHDDGTVTVARDDNQTCGQSPRVGVELCKWNTIVGTLTVGGQPAAGYGLDLVDMSVNPPVVVDTDTSTAAGVFSLEDLSSNDGAGQNYRINLSNTGGTFISTTGDFLVDTCGATSVFTYTSGVWTDDGVW